MTKKITWFVSKGDEEQKQIDVELIDCYVVEEASSHSLANTAVGQISSAKDRTTLRLKDGTTLEVDDPTVQQQLLGTEVEPCAGS